MAALLLKVGDRANTNYKEYLVEHDEDLSDIKDCSFGDRAYCIETDRYHYYLSNGTWTKYN